MTANELVIRRIILLFSYFRNQNADRCGNGEGCQFAYR